MEPFRPQSLTLLAAILIAVFAACGTPSGTASISSPTPAGSTAISPAASPSSGPSRPFGPLPHVIGSVTAGPVCPVERNPPDPSCAPRPVAGAVIVATADGGHEVGRATTAADGTFDITMYETGTFVITGLPVTGLMGLPDPVTVTLSVDHATAQVDLEYDTGIR